MEREDADINFSTEDPENVVIKESLGPVAYEYFDAIAYILNRNENLAIAIECLELLKEIQKYSPKFLLNENKFSNKIVPFSKKILKLKPDRDLYSNFQLKYVIKFFELALAIIDNDISFIILSKEDFMKELNCILQEVKQNIIRNNQIYNSETALNTCIQQIISIMAQMNMKMDSKLK